MILAPRKGFGFLMSLLIGPYLPFLVGLTKEDVRRLFPFMEKNVYEMLRETGYMHIQATKPDTAGSTKCCFCGNGAHLISARTLG